MKIDLKLVLLVLVVLCLVGEISGWWLGGGSRRRRQSVRRRTSYRYIGGYSPSRRRTGYSGYGPPPSVRRRYRTVRRRVSRVRQRVRPYRRRISRVRRRVRRRRRRTTRTGPFRRKLYNKRVVRVAKYNTMWLGVIPHSGVVVTTASGKKYLVHKIKDCITRKCKDGHTIVEDGSTIRRGKWIFQKSKKVKGVRIGDFVVAGGKGYDLLLDNCLIAADRMYKING